MALARVNLACLCGCNLLLHLEYFLQPPCVSLSAVHDRREGFLGVKAFELSGGICGLRVKICLHLYSKPYYIHTDSVLCILELGIVGQKTFPAMVHVQTV